MVYNVILECLTLNVIKAIVAPLLIQFELDERVVLKMRVVPINQFELII